MKFNSQIGQDEYFINNFNKGRKKGYFVDIGAHDGISYSNTYTLEKELEWVGLCIEVCDVTFNKLISNRNCKCVNECVYSESGIEKELDIPLSNPLPEGNDMLIRIKNSNTGFSDQFKEITSFKKITKSLTDIFKENNVPAIIQYMSIDIEGADLDALKGLDFAQYSIEFLTIEWGGSNEKLYYFKEISDFLKLKGYSLHRVNRWDAEFTKDINYINSFDIFDTILARKVLNPCDIFSIIEVSFPFPNFRNYRCNAQYHSNSTFDDIYIKFKELYNIDNNLCNRLKEYEIETEIKYSYLITSNYNRIKDGDILISDMYLCSTNIQRILKTIGFSKNITLYVTPNGKANGTIWNPVKHNHNINLHLGDNIHSDIYMATNACVKAEYTNISQLNDTEYFFINNDLSSFAFILREFRHKNPYEVNTNNYELYNDQACFNIPLLILCATKLYSIMKNENRTKLLLITRDSCLLKQIFPILYPDIECVELHSSRQINKNPNQEYKDYLKSIYNKDTCLIFDIYGGFVSGRELFKELFGEYPRVHLIGYSDYFKGSDIYNGLTYSCKECFEGLNYDCIGSLIKLENGRFIRPPVIEYNVDDTYIYKITVESFCKFIKNIQIENFIQKTFNLINNNLLELYIKKINRKHHIRINNLNCAQQKIDLYERIWNHQSLTTMANILKVSKGSFDEHCHTYTEHYEYLFSKWYNKPCSILDIGLNRYLNKPASSIDLWRAYMCDKTKVYGFDSNKHFEKFNNPSENIFIIIGDTRNTKEIERCYITNYDIVVEDGDHDSRSQQLMFKTIWKSLNSGGVYCIESLHWQPSIETCIKTVNLFMNWKNGKVISSDFIPLDEANIIFSQIDRIEFYDSKCSVFDENIKKNALCCIWKK